MIVEVSTEYLEALSGFSEALTACAAISQQCGGIPSPTSRHTYAAMLFTALCTRALSLGIAAPRNKWAIRQIDHWDYISLFGLTRGILEIRLAFHYISVERCSPNEWGLRWNLFNLHDCCARIKLFKALGQNDQVLSFEQQASVLRNRISGNRFFKENKLKLSDKQHRELLSGNKCYLYPLEDIASRAGIPGETFRLLWQHLSSHVHAFPVAFYRMMDGERGRGVHSLVEEGYARFALLHARDLLNSTLTEMDKLFAKR